MSDLALWFMMVAVCAVIAPALHDIARENAE